MEFLESFVAFTNDILWSYVLIVMLVGLGIWFSLRTRFVQVRCLKEMVRLLKEGVGQKTEHNHISSFQAFCVSTASRVGVGNIAGIAIAIVSGGPGAIFWMWIIAIDLQAVAGGGMGAALMTGIKRGLFSNEAGMGSVPNAAATASASHPVKQGLIQAFGVFVDTLLVCSASAFIVLLSDGYTEGKLTGIELVQQSLSQHLGPWAPSFLAGMICLFAFSSIVGNYYYGEINIGFISKNYMTLMLFRVFVVGMVLFGSVAKVALVWDLADLFMALMAITNLVAIAILGKYAYIALHDYMDQKRAGIVEPEFDPAILPSQRGIEVWKKE